ncbi:MAG: hypothetical protein K0S58_3609, partial [Nitrospira sp.]|nr:hypothetical protein [Nitrospira sp.]
MDQRVTMLNRDQLGIRRRQPSVVPS